MKTFTLFKRGPDAKRLPPTSAGYRDRPFYFTFEMRGVSITRCTEQNDAEAAQKRARHLHQYLTTNIRAAEYARGRVFTREELRDALKAGDLQATLDASKLRHAATATFSDIFPVYRKYARVTKDTCENNIDALVNVVRTAKGFPDWTETDLGPKPLTLLNKLLALDFQRALGATDYSDAATNFNSLLRQAASVFAARRNNNMLAIYAESGLKIPECVKSFKTAPTLREPSHEFQAPSPGLIARIRAAAPALKASDPNCYRIYLLAFGCALSKIDIANLTGSHFKHDDGRHRIELRRSKSHKLVIFPADEAWPELVSLNPTLAAPRSADPIAPLYDYILEGDLDERYNESFRRFGLWLTSLGWNQRKKAHGLRKLAGSLLDEQLGTDQASKLLGNTREVFDSHYRAQLNLPRVKILGHQTP